MSKDKYDEKVISTEKQKHYFEVRSPYSKLPLGAVMKSYPKDIPSIIAEAQEGSIVNRNATRKQRADVLTKAATLIEKESEAFARLIVVEAGKTIAQARKEVARCINTIRVSGEEAKRLSGEILPFDAFDGAQDRYGHSTKVPLGIVLAITPFNDPLNLVAHKLGPAIASGNSIILKPSELTPFSAIKLVDTLIQAGLDKRIVSVVFGDSSFSQELVKSKTINMVSFTGGTETAESITQIAGLKKIAMDLGGVASVLVMQDADLELAVRSCVSGAFWASGQNCIGTQHILVHKSVYKEFKSLFLEQVSTLSVGDPAMESTDVGPMINEKHAIRSEFLVDDAINKGALVLCGHSRTDNLYMPTVLENVPDNAKIAREEVFGPVVTLRQFETLKEAISIANSPDTSLHAGIFTKDLHAANYAADNLAFSGVMINDSSDFRVDIMPFGGFKYGSLGREGIRYSIDEMTQSKVICFRRG